MAAMIWDNELQAWKEAATPRIWNPALEAYEDTTGLVWNPELEAWEERWNPSGGTHLWRDGIIPAMTSVADETTNGVGIVTADSYITSEPYNTNPYSAFAWHVYTNNDTNRIRSDCWISDYTTNAHHLTFTFLNARYVKYVKVYFRAHPINFYRPYAYIQYTADGSKWDNLWYGRTNNGGEVETNTDLLYLDKVVKGVRIYTPSTYSGDTQRYIGVKGLQCYNR